jgi:hypothetical protein
MPLLPEHIADLRASGLRDQSIALMRIESVEPSDCLKSKGVTSAYKIPYLTLGNCPPDFSRERIFPPFVDENGRTRKYSQPKGTGCRLYVLELVVDLLGDYTKPIYYVEGEKKAAKGWQEGLGCVVGLGGIWNFLDRSGELIPEFDRIVFRSREHFCIPDSDVWARRDLLEAIYEFGHKVQERGGKNFCFIQLPPGADGTKCGLDDFLLSHSVDDLQKLPKVTLAGPGWTLEKKAHKAREARRDKKGEVEAEVEREKKEEIPKDLIARAWPTRNVVIAVKNTVERFVFIKDSRMYLLISCWIVGTYVYESFEYYPILWVTSPTKRSGKTKLLEVLKPLVSKPTDIKINLTEAILFRATNRGQTLLLDEVEKLKHSAGDVYAAIIGILNGGFQKGAVVSRVQKKKDGELVEVDYKIFCPKIVSGIANVADTIADRALKVKMLRRVRSREKVQRFRPHKLTKELGDLVFQLKIWAAARANDIQTIYDGIDTEPDELKDADDRFLDVIEPLLAIAALADAENANGASSVFDELLGTLKSLSGEREDTQGETAIAIAIDIITKELGSNSERFVGSNALLKKFQERSGLDWIKTTKRLATFLDKLDLTPKPDSTGKYRGYSITQRWLEDMTNRYSSLNSDFDSSDLSESKQKQDVTAEKQHVRKEDSDMFENVT